MAAVLWADEEGAVSHRAAAVLWGLVQFYDVGMADVVEVVTARRRNHPGNGVIVHLMEHVPYQHVRRIDGIPVTCVERTLLELGGVCRPWVVREALDDVLRRQLTTLDRLNSFLGEFGERGRNGTATLRRLLAAHDGSRPRGSRGERYLERIIVEEGFERPTPQFELLVGSRRLYPDLSYPHWGVAIEYLGYEPHLDREQWDRDQARFNLYNRVGWRVVLVTGARLKRDREGFFEDLRQAIQIQKPAFYRGKVTESGTSDN